MSKRMEGKEKSPSLEKTVVWMHIENWGLGGPSIL